jgi:hypothetical protein
MAEDETLACTPNDAPQLRSMFAALRRFFTSRQIRSNKRPPIVLTTSGFELRRADAGCDEFRWDQAERILAYKVDLLTTDEIFVAFEYHDANGRQMTFEVSEECPGFQDFMTALGRAFPTITADWYPRVMKPAFARNLIVLYPAENSDGEQPPRGAI